MSLFYSTSSLVSFVMTFIISLFVTRLMISANISDIPVDRSAHVKPTPRAGGLAIVISFFVGAWVLLSLNPPPQGYSWGVLILVAGVIAFGAGVSFLDDIKHVPYRIRLLIQAFIAMALVWVGLKIQCPQLDGFIGLPLIEFLLTLLFIVFVTNAANFVDGLNGLLSGSVLVAIPFMILISLVLPSTPSSDYWLVLICLILFAAILGFYLFNFPKGRIFMGDVGSVFIGLMVGVIALIGQKGHQDQPTWLFVNARLFLLIYPLGFIWFDPVFTVLRRYCLGRSMFEPNRDFLLHILNRAGYSHAKVSLIHYGSVFILGLMALLTPLGYVSFVDLALFYCLLQSTYVAWVIFVARQNKVKL